MNWYLAKLHYRILIGYGNHTPQFEEQLRLIYADDELHAFHKARLAGEANCLNGKADKVIIAKWKFIDVTELHLLTCQTDTAEVYAVINEEKDAALYIKNIHRTAASLLERACISLPV